MCKWNINTQNTHACRVNVCAILSWGSFLFLFLFVYMHVFIYVCIYFNQVQKEELNTATGQSAEEAKEWKHWQDVEKENSRLKTEMASLPILLKENDRMKKELESIPALQKEVETLRSTVTELKLSSGTKGQREEAGKGYEAE